jgi:5-amino-6-(5-phosphoribosylamino)uracil reductase
MERPFVLMSVAMSLDGHIDDGRPERLILSGAEDLDRVDAERAGVDAILVGPGTIAADNPRLLVRSAARRAGRLERGTPASPIKVTLTRTGAGLDPGAQFFTTGEGERLVYTAPTAVEDLRRRLAGVATVIDAGEPLRLPAILADLVDRKVTRLMVEGGTAINTLFLGAGVVDELQVVVAPLLVGDPAAPGLVGNAAFPGARMRLAQVRQVGDCALLVYRPAPDV